MHRGISIGVSFAIVVGLAISIAALSRRRAAAQNQGQSIQVTIDNFSFGPDELRVPAGAIVTWTNRDNTPHTVTSSDGAFKSRALDTGDKFSYTFAKRGTFSYFCSIHPKMVGKIVVQ